MNTPRNRSLRSRSRRDPEDEHPYRCRARRDRPHRPDARRPAPREVDRGDVPRRRHLLLRGARHARLHRHLARASGLRAGVRDGPAVAGDLRQRALHRVRRADSHPGRLVRCPDREARPPRRRDRLGCVHRLVDEPAALPRPRLRTRRGLRPAVSGVRRRAGAGRRHHARGPDLLRRPVLQPAPGADAADGRPRRARRRDGGERALHDRRAARPSGARDLHRLRPRRHRRGDHQPGA